MHLFLLYSPVDAMFASVSVDDDVCRFSYCMLQLTAMFEGVPVVCSCSRRCLQVFLLYAPVHGDVCRCSCCMLLFTAMFADVPVVCYC